MLHTDASMTGIGAAQYQAQDGQTWVEAYASCKYVIKKMFYLKQNNFQSVVVNIMEIK